ncbi:MAG: phospholipase D-like domain-containing protein [Pseudomonadota bacterium]
MRALAEAGPLRVHAVAGTYVVLLGFHLPEDACDGLAGFAIHKWDHTAREAHYLGGIKTFSETDPGLPPGSLNSTREHPIQSFQWADYGAVPGHEYTYTVEALTGPPTALEVMEKVEIEITTEHPATGDHDIYFNRGIAGSQAFARRFGDVAPDEIPNNKGYEWLSRGLAEALWAYIETAEPGRHALRIAAYEFNYEPFLQIVQAAHARGVDIEVVYDARRDSPREANRAAIVAAGLEAIAHERTQPKSYISHNKFIVKLEDGAPVSVWTGGTNFSDGGIYGHSNVAHVVEEPRIAEAFLTYWEALKRDPESTPLKGVVEALSPLPPGRPPVGTTVLFSPRANLDALSWYADLAKAAEDGLFITFAFGMNDIFKEVYDTANAPFRLALMEKKTRPMREGPERDAEEARIQALRNKPENVFAIGDFIRTNSVDGWLKERLTGLNSHVRYVHNKFMLIDPLSRDPIVIGGSANFSDASTRRNDENMVITRGNTRVADIYLGEFMRLFSHHAFRESLEWRDPDDPPKPLRTGDWWRDYFGDTPRSTRRKYFARLF